jgi:hypothetical protein
MKKTPTAKRVGKSSEVQKSADPSGIFFHSILAYPPLLHEEHFLHNKK